MTDKERMYANPLEWKLMVAKNTGHTKVTYDELNGLVETINRQQAEIERLKDEVSTARRKALLEASGKFAGHSDYHGDTVLVKLICMAEGKEVGEARPLDKNEIKAEAIKEYIEKCIMEFCCGRGDDRMDCYICEDDFFEIMKEMVGEDK